MTRYNQPSLPIEYAQKPISGPWQLPAGWQWRTIGSENGLCQVNPRRPQITRNPNTATSFLPMEGVDEQEGKIKELQVRSYEEVRSGYTYFEENDVLFAKITPSMQNGKAAIAHGLLDGFGFGSTEFHVLRPKVNVEPEWIHFFVRQLSFREEAKQYFRGAVGQQRVPATFLEEHLIPMPYPDNPERSLAEQHRIVARLETLFVEVWESRKINNVIKAETDRLMDAVLHEIFSTTNTNWIMEPLENLVENFDSIRVPVRKADRANMQGVYPYYGATGIIDYVDDYLFDGEYLLISEDGANLVARKYPIAFIATGKFWVNNHAHVVNAIPQTSNQFLAYAIAATDISEFITGSAQPKLNQTNLNKIPVKRPRNKQDQDQIVAHLKSIQDEIQAMQEIQTQDEQSLEQVEQAILAQAFRGEL